MSCSSLFTYVVKKPGRSYCSPYLLRVARAIFPQLSRIKEQAVKTLVIWTGRWIASCWIQAWSKYRQWFSKYIMTNSILKPVRGPIGWKWDTRLAMTIPWSISKMKTEAKSGVFLFLQHLAYILPEPRSHVIDACFQVCFILSSILRSQNSDRKSYKRLRSVWHQEAEWEWEAPLCGAWKMGHKVLCRHCTNHSGWWFTWCECLHKSQHLMSCKRCTQSPWGCSEHHPVAADWPKHFQLAVHQHHQYLQGAESASTHIKALYCWDQNVAEMWDELIPSSIYYQAFHIAHAMMFLFHLKSL